MPSGRWRKNIAAIIAGSRQQPVIPIVVPKPSASDHSVFSASKLDSKGILWIRMLNLPIFFVLVESIYIVCRDHSSVMLIMTAVTDQRVVDDGEKYPGTSQAIEHVFGC